MNDKEKRFVSVGVASDITGIGKQSIRQMFDEQILKGYRTPSNQRRIDRDCLEQMLGVYKPDNSGNPGKRNFIYCRVSTKKQMDDLTRQVAFIRGRPEYSEYILIQDVASGINWKRKGLQTILDSCLQGTIGEVVVAHRDRLCRFGFELFEILIAKAGGKLTVLQEDDYKTPEQELTDDLLSIIHVFSCKRMGSRKYKRTGEANNAQNQA